MDQVPACSIPANVLKLLKEQVLCREIGPRLPSIRSLAVSFWELLQSIGGEWMWEDAKEGDTDVEWVRDALINGTFIGVTDGSYDREKAKTVSCTGWMIVCKSSQRTLRGSFFEMSTKAGSYRGELLGLVADVLIFWALLPTYGKSDFLNEKNMLGTLPR
jgi:hypothetical protein